MKENNWKTEETLARTVVTLETERIKLVQSLMFMMMIKQFRGPQHVRSCTLAPLTAKAHANKKLF